jgi:hypothetical protein
VCVCVCVQRRVSTSGSMHLDNIQGGMPFSGVMSNVLPISIIALQFYIAVYSTGSIFLDWFMKGLHRGMFKKSRTFFSKLSRKMKPLKVIPLPYYLSTRLQQFLFSSFGLNVHPVKASFL